MRLGSWERVFSSRSALLLRFFLEGEGSLGDLDAEPSAEADAGGEPDCSTEREREPCLDFSADCSVDLERDFSLGLGLGLGLICFSSAILDFFFGDDLLLDLDLDFDLESVRSGRGSRVRSFSGDGFLLGSPGLGLALLPLTPATSLAACTKEAKVTGLLFFEGIAEEPSG